MHVVQASLLIGTLVCVLSPLASAQTFSDDFESYAVGSALEGQGGWSGWDNVNTMSTVVSAAQARSGSQSMQVDYGTDTVQQFTPATSGTWIFEAWIYAPSSFDGQCDIMVMNSYAHGGPYEWGSQVLVEGQNSTVSCNCGGAGASSTPLPRDRWIEIRKVIDLDGDTATIYFDGTLFSAYTWTGGTFGAPAHPIPSIEGLDIYVYPNIGTDPGLFIDDVRLYRQSSSIGSSYSCMAVPNSTGSTGAISAIGSTIASAGDLTLVAENLPTSQFGIFVTSLSQAFVPGAGGTSNGNLCVGGSIGRFSAPNQILSTGTTGSFELTVDTALIPQGASFVTIAPGDTWNFQAWHRDPVGLGSNFTDGVTIDFQ